MTLKELATIRRKWLDDHLPYKLWEWSEFNYKMLDNILYRYRAGQGNNDKSLNDIIIMCDTETSKQHPNITMVNKDGTTKYIQVDNYIVAWTISLRAFGRNIATLYGHKPSEFTKCIQKIIGNMNGYQTIFYWHNMAYDWVFIRKFMFEEFGLPIKQLNVKPHYPINIEWENGIIFKDSLILAQRSLEKWANDMDVEHKKASGKWDYDKIRSQSEVFTPEELEYIEHDTLAGVECIDKLRISLNKSLYSMPYTATGIPREAVRKLGKPNKARDIFKSMVSNFKQQQKLEQVFHGGYTHANRHLIDVLIDWVEVQCCDFASSYPFICLSEKLPMERFSPLEDKSIEYILNNKEEYAFMFKLILIKPRLKDDQIPMPALQFSKCIKTINAICDNGRILAAEYIEIYLTEMDLAVINEQYTADKHICCEVEVAKKEYLPRYLTDYIYSLFNDKTMLKGGDKVLYALAKALLNSVYGMMATHPTRQTINEDYLTGDYQPELTDPEELYDDYVKKRGSILCYQWGVWITSYAFYNLFQLGKCCGTWVYSDTDSIYGYDWDWSKVQSYNQICKDKLLKNSYGPVLKDGREYWLGVAESDPEEDVYTQFKVQGAKRYCGRNKSDGELHITVAGVPKKGAKCLNNDINNFTKGMIFDGITTGKLTHTYKYVEEIYTDEYGNEVGDSIDLTPCDYKLDSVNAVDWEKLFEEQIEVITYEE